ncbi:hypothetical protein WG66_004070 [Moniliophthora roreri]|nr:hypothetical protein WG66_004070 [Moniliophthora roreri]
MEKALDIESPVQLCDKYYFEFPSNHERSLGIALLKDYVKEKPANHVPFDHEIPVLAPLLRQAEDELAAYDDAMEILRRKRDDLYILKERARGMIRPSIRRLPPELLLRIFTMCESSMLGAHNPLQPICHTILTLSHVCAHWRATTSSKSTLWSNIYIRFKVRDDKAIARRIHSFTKFCLEKSKTRPLNIYFDTPSEPDGYRDEYDDWIPYSHKLHRRTLREVVKHGSRWRDITLNLQDDTIDLPDALPFLESLNVRMDKRTNFEDRADTPSGPIFTPCLRHLQTHNIETSVLTRLDTRSLVRFSTNIRDSVFILKVLRDSPTLREVTLFMPIDAFDGTPTPGNVVHSQLQCLKTFYSPRSSGIFQHLSLPSLTFLDVSCERPNLGNDGSALLAFLQRSRPPLSKLTIRDFSFTPEDWTHILKLLPSVTELRFHDFSGSLEQTITTQLLEPLTISASSSTSGDILLPNLTALGINVFKPFDGKVVLDMVRSRLSRAERAGAKRLEYLFLDCYEHHLGHHAYDVLYQLGVDGELDVYADLIPETSSETCDSDSDSDDSDDSSED